MTASADPADLVTYGSLIAVRMPLAVFEDRPGWQNLTRYRREAVVRGEARRRKQDLVIPMLYPALALRDTSLPVAGYRVGLARDFDGAAAEPVPPAGHGSPPGRVRAQMGEAARELAAAAGRLLAEDVFNGQVVLIRIRDGQRPAVARLTPGLTGNGTAGGSTAGPPVTVISAADEQQHVIR